MNKKMQSNFYYFISSVQLQNDLNIAVTLGKFARSSFQNTFEKTSVPCFNSHHLFLFKFCNQIFFFVFLEVGGKYLPRQQYPLFQGRLELFLLLHLFLHPSPQSVLDLMLDSTHQGMTSEINRYHVTNVFCFTFYQFVSCRY